MVNEQEYLAFLESKIDVAPEYGDSHFNWELLDKTTKPHQRDTVAWLLRQGRALNASVFGLGKTTEQIELARILVNAFPDRPFLQITPLGVRTQFINEDGPRLGVKYEFVRSDAEIQDALKRTPYLITNYERVRDGKIDVRLHNFCGVSLDEASIIGNLGTKTWDVFTRLFRDIEYRFVNTATPAPNDYRQIIYYAEFLGIMDHGQVLTRWFKRNPDKAGDLQITPGKEDEFWLWVSTWALFLYSPEDMGYDGSEYVLPKIHVHWHRLDVDHTRAFNYIDNRGQRRLLLDDTGNVSQMSKERRFTLPDRVAKMQEILGEYPERHFLLWHYLEDERRAVEKALPESRSVYGSQDLDIREERILDFTHGRIKYLSTKPVLAGSGCNFQRHCADAIFLGPDYKFKDVIQAIHRIHRFLQTREVNIHFIYAESQQHIVDTFKRKWMQHDALVARMRKIIKDYGLSHSATEESLRRRIGVTRMKIQGERFMAVNNDCVLEMKNISDNSVGLIHTSIPFGNHYEYTTNYEDFGHNPDNDKFFAQMDFLIPEMHRVLMPGRICAIHVKDRILYGHQTKSGFMEVDPFSDLTRAAFQKHGFLYEGRRTIITDVVRENNSTYRLGWTEMTKDSSKMGSGLPEYILLFRKKPTLADTARADTPVIHDKQEYTRARWQVDAHAFWQSNGNVLMPQEPEAQVEYLLNLLEIKQPYDHAAHVERLEQLEAKGNLPASFFIEPPVSKNQNVWDDVFFMRCLNSTQGRRGVESHICPLPLDIVERIIRLYSNPGDVVLDTFGGLGTVGYMAVQLGRYGHIIELSAQYFKDAVYYLEQIEQKVLAPTLFDFAGITIDENAKKTKMEFVKQEQPA